MDFTSCANLDSNTLFFPYVLKEFSINYCVEGNSSDKGTFCKAQVCAGHIFVGAMAAVDKMFVLHYITELYMNMVLQLEC